MSSKRWVELGAVLALLLLAALGVERVVSPQGSAVVVEPSLRAAAPSEEPPARLDVEAVVTPLVAPAAITERCVAPPPRHYTRLLSLGPDGRTLAGRVLDEERRPLADAEVLLIADSWGHHGEFYVDEVDRALTEADGNFVLDAGDEDEPWNWWLHVRAPGRAPVVLRVAVRGGSTDIVLAADLPLRGRLRFADGRPVASAAIHLCDPGLRFDRRRGGEEWRLGVTDGEGRFDLRAPADLEQPFLTVFHEEHDAEVPIDVVAWRADAERYELDVTWPVASCLQVDLVGDLSEWEATGLMPRIDLAFPVGTPIHFSSGPMPDDGERRVLLESGSARLLRLLPGDWRLLLTAGTVTHVLDEHYEPRPGWTKLRLPVPPWPGLAPGDAWLLDVTLTDANDAPLAPPAWTTIGAWSARLTAADGATSELRFFGPTASAQSWTASLPPVRLELPWLREAGVVDGIEPGERVRLRVEAAALRRHTASVVVDLQDLAAPPREIEVRFDREGADGTWWARCAGLEHHGLPPGRYVVTMRGEGIHPRSQTLDLAAGVTTSLRAVPIPPPTAPPPRGILLASVCVSSKDPWIRATRADVWDDTMREVSQVHHGSFRMELRPGEYHGRLSFGRALGPERWLGQLVDYEARRSESELPGMTLDFEASVREGEVTQLELAADAGAYESAFLVVTRGGLPVDEDVGLDVKVATSSGKPVLDWRMGGCPAEGVSLALRPGDYVVSVGEGGASASAPLVMREGRTTEVTVELDSRAR